MLSNILKALGAGWVPYAIGAALILGGIWYVYDLGGDNRALAYKAKIATIERNYASAALAEGTRQADVNADAKAREAIVIATIAAQSAKLTDLQRKLDNEQDSDPTSSVDCINDAARLRLNQIH